MRKFTLQSINHPHTIAVENRGRTSDGDPLQATLLAERTLGQQEVVGDKVFRRWTLAVTPDFAPIPGDPVEALLVDGQTGQWAKPSKEWLALRSERCERLERRQALFSNRISAGRVARAAEELAGAVVSRTGAA